MNPTRRRLCLGLLATAWAPGVALAAEDSLIVDDLSTPGFTNLGTRWRPFTDQVMGGRSSMDAGTTELAGRKALAFVAEVTTANNGGFAQIAAELHPQGDPVDLSAFTALELDVYGNDEDFDVHLRTTACRRPWQYYTQRFAASRGWRTVRLPLADFEPKSLDAALDPTRVLRLGLVAYGRDFRAELAVSRVAFV